MFNPRNFMDSVARKGDGDMCIGDDQTPRIWTERKQASLSCWRGLVPDRMMSECLFGRLAVPTISLRKQKTMTALTKTFLRSISRLIHTGQLILIAYVPNACRTRHEEDRDASTSDGASISRTVDSGQMHSSPMLPSLWQLRRDAGFSDIPRSELPECTWKNSPHFHSSPTDTNPREHSPATCDGTEWFIGDCVSNWTPGRPAHTITRDQEPCGIYIHDRRHHCWVVNDRVFITELLYLSVQDGRVHIRGLSTPFPRGSGINCGHCSPHGTVSKFNVVFDYRCQRSSPFEPDGGVQ